MYLILRRSLLVNFAVLLALSSLAAAAPECHGIFTADTHNSKAIETTIEQLAAYRVKLDVARAEGQSSAALSAMEADYTKKEKSLVVHIKKNNLMSLEELREKLISATARIQNQKSKERETEKEKKEDQVRAMDVWVHDGRRMIFYPIKPGTFKTVATQAEPSRYVTIATSFEMMSTHVTKLLWKQIVDLAPLTPSGSKSRLYDQSDYSGTPLIPATGASYEHVKRWLTVLNELSQQGAPELNAIIVGHQKGDVYRLPTADEWEFVASKRGQNADKFLFEESLLQQYAWYNENSGNKLQAVATKNALEFEGMFFFDMTGNASTLTSTLQPPSWDKTALHVIIKGGNFASASDSLNRSFRTSFSLDTAATTVGVRLVRESRATGATP